MIQSVPSAFELVVGSCHIFGILYNKNVNDQICAKLCLTF